MNLDQMRSLCAIVDTGSFSAAADRVHLSQPAVSQQIRKLERELAHQLVDRETGAPTAVGRRVYERAVELLRSVESLRRELADFGDGQDRALRVGTSDTVAFYVLPPVISAFAKAMPGVRLVLINRPSVSIMDQVRDGEIDLGIVTLPADRAGIEVRALFEQELVLVTLRSHPMARRHVVELSHLSGEPFLMLDSATRTGEILAGHFAAHDFRPSVVLDSGSFEVIKRYIAEGIGVSFLPRPVVTRSDRTLTAITVPGLPRLSFGAVWRRGTYRTKAENAFLDLAIEASRMTHG